MDTDATRVRWLKSQGKKTVVRCTQVKCRKLESTDYEASRHEEALISAELQSRERVEMDELKVVVLKLAEVKEIYADSPSRREENQIQHEMQESQSTANQLRVQIQELHEHINSLNHARDLKDLATASCSGSFQSPCQP